MTDEKEQEISELHKPIGIILVITIVVLALSALVVAWSNGDPTEGNDRCYWFYEVESSTEARVIFGAILPPPEPMKLRITLLEIGGDSGTYNFTSNGDGALEHTDGTDIGTLVYEDHDDNGKADMCDQILISNLNPESHYEALIIWASSGDVIERIAFRTPAE